MKTSYNTCPFHTSEFLKKYIITIPNTRVRNDKQRNLKITSSDKGRGIRLSPPEGSSTQDTPQASPATGVNKP